MLNLIVNDQVTKIQDGIYVKLMDEGLDPGFALEAANEVDLEVALATA